MADLMKNPTEWGEKEVEKLAVANTLRKHWIEIEHQKAEAITYLRNFKMQRL